MEKHSNISLFAFSKHAGTNKRAQPNISLSDSAPVLCAVAADLARIYAAQSQRLH